MKAKTGWTQAVLLNIAGQRHVALPHRQLGRYSLHVFPDRHLTGQGDEEEPR